MEQDVNKTKERARPASNGRIKVLMISTDAKILEEGTPVRARMVEYGKLFSELHIVVFTKKNFQFPIFNSQSNPNIKIAENVFVYGTNSISKLTYVNDAIKIGTHIIENWKLEIENCVVTTQDPFETGLVGKSLSQKYNIPLHIQIHTDFYSPYFQKSILNKVRITLSRRTLPQAKAVRVVSERIKISLPEDIQKKTSILPIFINGDVIKHMPITTDLKEKYPQFKKIVLIASRLTKEKDIENALSAFKEVLNTEPYAGLIIVGEGSELYNLKFKISHLKLKDAVFFEPWAKYETLISYMKTCDVFLSSSLYEGYGLSMLEAYTAGAFIVATDAGIAPLLTSPECLVSPLNKEGLKTALLKALSGKVVNKDYKYPYTSEKAYFEAYKADIERALL